MPRTRPHFRVHLSVEGHEKMQPVWQNAELTSLWVHLGVAATRKFAAKTDDRLTIRKSELMDLACVRSHKKAASLLRTLAELLEWSLDVHDTHYVIGFRNFAKKQGFASRFDKQRAPSELRTPNTERRVEEESVASAPPPRSVPDKAPQKPEPDYAVGFAQAFARGLQKVHDRPKIPRSLTSWARAARFMVEQDGRTHAELESVLRFLFDTPDSEVALWWRPNILSVPKLRKRWDQIKAQRAREKSSPKRLSWDDQQALERRKALGLTP